MNRMRARITRTRRLVIGCAASACAMAVACDNGTGPGSGPRQLLFAGQRNGQFDIFRVNDDGSGLVSLTPGSDTSNDWQPAWTDNRQVLAFSSDRTGNWDIFVADASGHVINNVTSDPSDDITPAWNPIGDLLVFASNRSGNFHIYTVATTGAALTRLTNGTADNVEPAWSPDGSQIAFSSHRDGSWEIYLMNTRGLNVRRLTTSGANDAVHATWCGDHTIAFATIPFNGSPSTISEIQDDGSHVTVVPTFAGIPVRDPSCSADGSRLLFAGLANGDWDIYADVFNRIAPSPGTDWTPVPVGH